MRDGKDADAAKLLADMRGKLPPDAMLEYVYGLALSHLSKNDEAIAAFQRSVTLDPKVAESRYELGKLYFQLGQIPEAREQFERVLAIAPDHANAHYQLSRVYARLGETEKSKEMAAKTQELLTRQRERRCRHRGLASQVFKRWTRPRTDLTDSLEKRKGSGYGVRIARKQIHLVKRSYLDTGMYWPPMGFPPFQQADIAYREPLQIGI